MATTAAALLLPPAPWTRGAACAGLVWPDLDVWHYDGADAAAARDLAVEVCSTCPVRQECLDLALVTLASLGSVCGIYAGLTPEELRSLARARERPVRKVAQHGTRSRYVGSRTRAPCRCSLCRQANARDEDARRKRVA
ncbi:MAG: WhiB family transcriptional regulator [Streptosporangiaceae bacterium]